MAVVDTPPRSKSSVTKDEESELAKQKEIAAVRAQEESKLEEGGKAAEAAADREKVAFEREKLEEPARQAGAGGGGTRGAPQGGKGDAAPPAAPAPSRALPANEPAAPDPAALDETWRNASVYCLVLPNERFAELRARAVQTPVAGSKASTSDTSPATSSQRWRPAMA